MRIKDLGAPIYGTGNLFKWGEDQILKVYGSEFPREFVVQLGEKEKSFYNAGLPVPKIGKLLEIEDSLGQVYERIEGKSLLDELISPTENDEPRVNELATIFAEVHFQIHSCTTVEVQMQHQRDFFPDLLERIDSLSDELKKALVNEIKEISEGNQICHGDFHPLNVLLSPKGPIVIDWNNSHIGNPLEDIARSKLILVGASRMYPSLKKTVDRFREVYLDRYFQLNQNGQDQIDRWWPIVSAIRLLDDIPELEDWLLEQIKLV
jgi:uncharacterized protein (TIGR02172 family)